MMRKESTKPSCCRMALNPKTIMSLFLLMALFVFLNLLVVSSGLAQMFGISNKMKGGFLDSINSFMNISSLTTSSNYSFFPPFVNKRHQLEHVTGDLSNDVQATLRSTSNIKRVSISIFNDTDKVSTNISKDTDSDKNNAIKVKDRNVNIRGNIIGTKNNTRREECNSCFEHNFNYVIKNDNICRLTSPGQVIDVIILITTVHRNLNQRNALRRTWLTLSKNNTSNVRYAFLLGETSDVRYRKLVIEENNLYHDIIKEDFVDSYLNLTYKTIMGFKWTANVCKNAQFVMKTDDDMFVNVPNVVKLVHGIYKDELEKTIVGSCSKQAKPIRNQKSKYYASEESYPEPFYPGFCSGTGYLTSMNVVRKVYEVSPNVPFFHLEDVYVSLCIRKLDYKLLKVPGFYTARPKLHPCLYKSSNIITVHHLSPVMLMMVWRGKCKPLVRL
ncbi:UDP-GalNAc beta-1 [Mactra antiquata]